MHSCGSCPGQAEESSVRSRDGRLAYGHDTIYGRVLESIGVRPFSQRAGSSSSSRGAGGLGPRRKHMLDLVKGEEHQ